MSVTKGNFCSFHVAVFHAEVTSGGQPDDNILVTPDLLKNNL